MFLREQIILCAGNQFNISIKNSVLSQDFSKMSVIANVLVAILFKITHEHTNYLASKILRRN